MKKLVVTLFAGSFLLGFAAACGDGADDLGIASECATTEDCPTVGEDDDEQQLACLTDFKGGYCGLTGCMGNDDCPTDSACIAHEGANYCFRTCSEKAECNANRGADNEANCSSSAELADGSGKQKACVPPSN